MYDLKSIYAVSTLLNLVERVENLMCDVFMVECIDVVECVIPLSSSFTPCIIVLVDCDGRMRVKCASLAGVDCNSLNVIFPVSPTSSSG